MTESVLLQAHDVSFGYGKNPHLLSSWDDSFRAGEIVAITGPSGRGKSTLLYLLGLMLQPSQGSVLVEDKNTAGLNDRGRARLRATVFGFVFQDAALDSTRTVLDNVIETALYRGQPRGEAIHNATQLMEQFGVSFRATHRPGQVSGGQAQRIALCRALLGRPKIILADEPTGNLDSESAGIVVDALRSRAHDGSVVVVATHDPGLVSKCDRSIQL